MATEIPTQFGFQHLMSHTFPGFFSAITLFMLLDLWSPLDLTHMVFYKGLDGIIAFTGFILLIGSILGIIIDAFHHWAIEGVFKKNNKIKEYERERFSYLKKCWDKNISEKGKFEECCTFRWENVPGRDADNLVSFLKRNFAAYWMINAISNEPNIKKNGEIIDIANGHFKLKHNAEDNTVNIETKDGADNLIACNYCIIDGDNLISLVKSEQCPPRGFHIPIFNKRLVFADDATSDLKEIKKHEKCPIRNLDRFYVFKEMSDKMIAINNYLNEQYYSYSEFYSNTFISLLAFSVVVPFYGYQVMHISFWSSIYIAGISLVLGFVCAIRSYAAYETYIRRINSVIRGYADAKTTNG